MTAGHRVQRRGIAPRNQGVEREALGMSFDEVTDLPANRPGCTE